MKTAVKAIIRGGKLDFTEPEDWPEEAQVLVTLLSDDERAFWEAAGKSSLDAVWDNKEDDVYAELLKR